MQSPFKNTTQAHHEVANAYSKTYQIERIKRCKGGGLYGQTTGTRDSEKQHKGCEGSRGAKAKQLGRATHRKIQQAWQKARVQTLSNTLRMQSNNLIYKNPYRKYCV